MACNNYVPHRSEMMLCDNCGAHRDKHDQTKGCGHYVEHRSVPGRCDNCGKLREKH